MKLYWCPRTRASRAVWALEEAGAAYERVLINVMAGPSDDPAFRAVSPMGKVPALADGDALMTDSAAICLYVADRYALGSLAPALDDPLRGRYGQWMIFTGTYLEPAVMAERNKMPEMRSMYGWGDAATMWDMLEEGLGTGPWMLGDRFTMADVMIGSTLHFGQSVGFAPDRPAFNAYVERCLARPAHKRMEAIEADSPAPSAPQASA